MKNILNLKSQWQIGNFGTRFFAILLILTPLCFIDLKIFGQTRGAQMPYTRYEAEDGVYGGGAALHGPTYDQTLLESEASDRKYIRLSSTGAYVQWVVNEEAEGMVLRFSIPDSSAGGGINRSLSMYVNSAHVANLQLTSKFAWQYFDGSNNPSNAPSVGRPRMRFDEYRMVLPDTLFAGDTIKLQKDASDTSVYYGIDFIELEPIPAEIPKPAGYLDVTTYGATTDDGTDDYTAFQNCINAASAGHKGMYVPKGRYIIGTVLNMKSNMTMQGAGIWYTDIYFSSMYASNGGLSGYGTKMKVSDLYLECNNTQRVTYRGIGDYWGTGSRVTNVWLTHFETGGWIANYSSASVTDSLIFSNCRIRNTYADGVNFARGTKNSMVVNCSFRNNGDDAMATWSSDTDVVAECSRNTFRYNTVENTYRAGGLGIFGGRGHSADHCIIKDNLYDGGIRITSIFPAHLFSTGEYINVSSMTLERTGPTTEWNTIEGAINLEARYFNVNNVNFDSIDIIGGGHHGIYIKSENSHSITDVHFKNMNINNVNNYGIYIGDGTLGWGDKSNVVITSPGTGNIYDNAPFVLKDLGIEILTISKNGLGDVVLDPPGGSYPTGTKVTLSANPAAGNKFDSWSGDLTGTVNPDTIIMSDYKSVTANFSVVPEAITNREEDRNVVCSPNPVIDQLTILFGDNSFRSISVYDCTGKIYISTSIDPQLTNYTLDLRNLARGLYFLKLGNNNKTLIYKIIKN
jgi:hypothetical protein